MGLARLQRVQDGGAELRFPRAPFGDLGARREGEQAGVPHEP